jgi:uncharacterized protein YggE
MKKEQNRFLIVTIFMTIAAIAIAYLVVEGITESNELKQTVNAEGIGEVSVIPDKVLIHFNIQNKGTTAKEAKDKNNEVLTKTITALKTLGYKEEEITTSNINVWEEYDWSEGGRTSIGFQATHNLVVNVDEEKNAAEIINTGIDAGALIGHVSFELEQETQNEYKTQAIKKATMDAKKKAEAIAEGLGEKLGEVVSISNSDFGYRPWIAYDNRAAIAEGAVSTSSFKAEDIQESITPTEKKVTARVSVSYELD